MFFGGSLIVVGVFSQYLHDSRQHRFSAGATAGRFIGAVDGDVDHCDVQGQSSSPHYLQASAGRTKPEKRKTLTLQCGPFVCRRFFAEKMGAGSMPTL